MRLTRAEREELRRRLAELEKFQLSEREALAPVEAARKGLLAEPLARIVWRARRLSREPSPHTRAVGAEEGHIAPGPPTRRLGWPRRGSTASPGR